MNEATTQLTIVPPSGDAGRFYEVVNGRIVNPAPPGVFESLVTTALVQHIALFTQNSRHGRMIVRCLFRIDSISELQRRPDLAFVSYERWPRDRAIPSTEAWDVIPDLAVEVIRPSTGASDVVAKIQEYFRAGVKLVWVIFPAQGQVYAYESPTSIRVLRRGDDLDGGTVLPGFRLPLTSLLEEDSESAD